MDLVLLKTLRAFLSLPVIINPLPITLTNGTNADATQVMTDLNWIVSQVNSNVPALIPSLPYTFVPQASTTFNSGTNTIALTPSPAASAYVDGLAYRFVFPAGATNTATVNVNVSGLGNKSVATTLFSDFQQNAIYDIAYSATLNSFTVIQPLTGGFTNFTPTLLFGGANVGMTSSVNTGQYTRIGPLTFAYIAITLTAKGSSTGIATIALPNICQSSSSIPIGQIQAANLTYAGQIAPAPQSFATTMRIQSAVSAGAITFLTDTAFANNTQLLISMWIP